MSLITIISKNSTAKRREGAAEATVTSAPSTPLHSRDQFKRVFKAALLGSESFRSSVDYHCYHFIYKSESNVYMATDMQHTQKKVSDHMKDQQLNGNDHFF